MPTDKELLGNAGEKIIYNYFQSQNIPIRQAVDPYDSEKDFTLYGNKKLENKTQVPFVTRTCFTIKDNHQLQKCLRADYLTFIQAPCKIKKENPLFNQAAIWQSNKGWEKTYYNYTTKDGRKMILLPMIQPSIVKLVNLTGEDYEILKKYGTKY